MNNATALKVAAAELVILPTDRHTTLDTCKTASCNLSSARSVPDPVHAGWPALLTRQGAAVFPTLTLRFT